MKITGGMNREWLKQHRNEPCLACRPRTLPYSLQQTAGWCALCERPWQYRYVNPDKAERAAVRRWRYLDDPHARWQRAPS